MTYVVSNIHGCYADFTALLKEINFSKNDVMFVLGDIVDIGDDPIELVCDLSMRENVWPVAGEHDKLAAEMLEGFSEMLKEGKTPDADFIAKMQKWVAMGGQRTLDGFRELDEDMREGVIDYLADMAPYETLHVGGKDYVLVHSGIKGYEADKELEDYDWADFCAEDADVCAVGDATMIVGHAPTTENFSCNGDIYRGDGFIAIDCGAARGGRLACLCLDNGEEYYV
jgi:serine/threonine protein phosphatase 1